MKTSISICIPTRNRLHYLLPLLKSIDLHYEGLEICISNNGDEDSYHVISEALTQNKLNYRFDPVRRGVSGNFENALSLATGEFIGFLGDDDVVGPGLLDVVEFAQREGIDCVIPYGDKFGVSYFWPGIKSRYFGDGYSSRLFISSWTGLVRFIDPGRELLVRLRVPGGNLGLLPRFYQGLVRKSVLDVARARYGTVFGITMSPDIHGAVLINSCITKAAYIDVPFIVPGAAPKSAAGMGTARTDRGALEKFDHARSLEKKWHEACPPYYCPETVWGQSLLDALTLVGREDEFNYCRFYSIIIVNNPSYAIQMISFLRSRRTSFSGYTHLALETLLEVGKKIGYILFRLTKPRPAGGAQSILNVEDSAQAADHLFREHMRRGVKII
jgi:glycosyltransferase involved in cell wall biosynthesis